MSRYLNLISGERIMTEQNALRHYISKAKKLRKNHNYETMQKLYSEATEIINIDCCHKCSQDDFGYCNLRNSDISNEDKFIKYCFDGFIRNMENELHRLMSN